LTAIDDAFNALFYGSGLYLGILLLITLTVALILKWKPAGLIMVIFDVILGIEYLNRDLGMPSLFMFIIATFTIGTVTYSEIKGRGG
jgi:hypothetical protein